MINMFTTMFKMIFELLKYPLYIVLIGIALFVVLCSFWFVLRLCQGKRLKKGTRQYIKKEGFFYKVFVKLPRQYVDDYFEREPDFFPYQGCIIFEGRQGAGKSIGMIEFARRMQKEFPLAKCITNIGYKYEDAKLKSWRTLINYKNGINGVIVVMDELQNWFSSNDSKNFPPEMLSVITQNRKNRRIILGTSQNFYLLAKAIRSQATEVRRCTTLLGALTIVRRFEPILDSEGNVQEFKYRGWYFFVHDKELRESYDTYKVIDRFKDVGFKEDSNVVADINTVFNFKK